MGSESVKRDMMKAKRLIAEKRYDDATAILITVDHPTADKWLNKLQLVTSSQTKAKNSASAPLPSFTGKYVLTVVLLFLFVFPGIVALSIFSREAKRATEQYGDDVPGAKELIRLYRFMGWFILAIVILFILYIVVVTS